MRGSSASLSSVFSAVQAGLACALISGTLDRLPMAHLLCDQLRTFPIVASFQDAHICWISAQVVTGCPRVHFRVLIRTSRPVPGGALGRLHSNLCRPVQLGAVH